jgi:hypothetical protein
MVPVPMLMSPIRMEILLWSVVRLFELSEW